MPDPHVLRSIACEGLQSHIVRGDIYEATAVATRVGDTEPWYCIPFDQNPVERLIAIDGRFLIAVGRMANYAGMQLAILDAHRRSIVCRTESDKNIILPSHLLVSKCRTMLWHVQCFETRRWSLPELDALPSVTLPFFHIDAAAVRDDGAIVAKARDKHDKHSDDRPSPPQIILIKPDLSVETFGNTRHEPYTGYATPHSNFALSPTGRFLLRPHDGSIRLTDRHGQAVRDLSQKIEDSDLFESLQSLFLHGAQELWSAAPLAFRVRLLIRSASLWDCLNEKPEPGDLAAEAQRKKATKSFIALRDSGEDARRLEAAKLEIEVASKAAHRLVKAHLLYRAAVNFSQLAPYDSWKPGDMAFFERGERPPDYNTELAPLNVVRGAVSEWDTGDGAFTVAFPDGMQRRVGIDGELGPLEKTPAKMPWLESHIPPELKAGAKQHIRSRSVPVFKLKRLDEPSCVAAIEDLAKRLRSDARSVIWGREMQLLFKHPGGELSEEAFFEFVATHCPNAAPSLRNLMAAFDDAKLEDEVWSTELVSASGFPAYALVRLDPSAFDALAGYFARRDPSHEPWGLENVFPALAPFQTLEALHFGVERLLDEHWRGHGDDGVVGRAVLRGARSILASEGFVALLREKLLQELRAAAQAERSNIRSNVYECLIDPLLRVADPTHSWDAAFVSLLRRKFRLRRTG